MVLMKYDTANNEPFITPTHGLYPDYVISVEQFKDRNARIMKNRWIDTSHGVKGEKIYELFNPDMDGEIVKESLQEWLCNHRHEITQSIGIALRNHEMSYVEWFRYINDQSGPDKLALYSLSCKHGIHTSVFNKSYIWMTLMNHVNRTDDEIISLSGINLVYLGATTYGIICDIRTPQLQPELNPTPPKSSGQTCWQGYMQKRLSRSQNQRQKQYRSWPWKSWQNITNTQRIKARELWYICYKCDTVHCSK